MPTHTWSNDRNQTTYIDLENPYEFFTSGDTVRGHVRVHPTERPNAIKIVFSGYCKMKIVTNSGRNRQTHRSNLELFRTSQLLFDSNIPGESYAILNEGTSADGWIDLPFETTFPDNVMMAPSDLYRMCQSHPEFEHHKGHPLPTSMEFDGNRVQYRLEALVYKTVGWSPDKIFTLALPFRPMAPFTTSTRLVASPRSSELQIVGHHLHPDNDQNPSLLTRMKWSTLSKYQHAIPGARWRIAAKCPYLLVAGEPIDISLSFSNIDLTPDLPTAPVVYLRQVGVKLTSILIVRIPYEGFTGTRDVMQRIDKQIICKVFVAGDRILYDGLRLDELGSFELPSTILPSFRTYGLRLLYRIKVVVEGCCANEEFKIVALRDLCEVVCDVQRPERGTPGSMGASRCSNEDNEPALQTPVVDQLPAYDPAPIYEEAPPNVTESFQ